MTYYGYRGRHRLAEPTPCDPWFGYPMLPNWLINKYEL